MLSGGIEFASVQYATLPKRKPSTSNRLPCFNA